jgi:hypothetical protein
MEPYSFEGIDGSTQFEGLEIVFSGRDFEFVIKPVACASRLLYYVNCRVQSIDDENYCVDLPFAVWKSTLADFRNQVICFSNYDSHDVSIRMGSSDMSSDEPSMKLIIERRNNRSNSMACLFCVPSDFPIPSSMAEICATPFDQYGLLFRLHTVFHEDCLTGAMRSMNALFRLSSLDDE